MNFDDSMRKYQNDPVFHGLVKGMLQLIKENKITPYEVREAGNFAMTMFQLSQDAQGFFEANSLPDKAEFDKYPCTKCGGVGKAFTTGPERLSYFCDCEKGDRLRYESKMRDIGL